MQTYRQIIMIDAGGSMTMHNLLFSLLDDTWNVPIG